MWKYPLLRENFLYYVKISFTTWKFPLLREKFIYYVKIFFTTWKFPLLRVRVKIITWNFWLFMDIKIRINCKAKVGSIKLKRYFFLAHLFFYYRNLICLRHATYLHFAFRGLPRIYLCKDKLFVFSFYVVDVKSITKSIKERGREKKKYIVKKFATFFNSALFFPLLKKGEKISSDKVLTSW